MKQKQKTTDYKNMQNTFKWQAERLGRYRATEDGR